MCLLHINTYIIYHVISVVCQTPFYHCSNVLVVFFCARAFTDGFCKTDDRLYHVYDLKSMSINPNIWVWVNTYRYITIVGWTSINPSYDLGFTRYQGFDPSPYGRYDLGITSTDSARSGSNKNNYDIASHPPRYPPSTSWGSGTQTPKSTFTALMEFMVIY